MATNTIASSDTAVHAVQLTANTVDTVNYAAEPGNVEIISDGAAAIYYTIDGTTPTVGGSKCRLLPAGAVCVDRITTDQGDTIKLISTGTPTYSVQRALRLN